MTGKNSFGDMPMWKRLAFASPIAVILLYAILKLQTISWVEIIAQTINLNFNAEVTYGSSFFDVTGNFGATDVELTQWSEDGEQERTYRVDKVTILTPGLGWLLRSAYGGVGDVAPDSFGMQLDNPHNIADADNTQGNYTHLPYDAKGCVKNMLTPSDLRAMGVDTKREVTVRVDQEGNNRSTITWNMRNEGVGEFDMRMHVGLPDDTEYLMMLSALQQAPLQSVELDFNDLGYVATRNEYCAKQHKLTPAAFDTYHMQEVDRRLKEDHVWFNDATLGQYADFAKNGGTLAMRTTGTRKVTLQDFLTKNWIAKMQSFPVTVSANGKPPVPLAVTWTPNAASVPAAVANPTTPAAPQVQPVATPAALVAPVAQAAATTPAPANGLPAPGSVVPFAALGALTGRHIDVSTKFGSVRKGELKLVGPLAINLLLDKEEGGLLLTMPADSIIEIKYTPVQGAPPAPPADASQAKAP